MWRKKRKQRTETELKEREEWKDGNWRKLEKTEESKGNKRQTGKDQNFSGGRIGSVFRGRPCLPWD